jgi:hypothetical protein
VPRAPLKGSAIAGPDTRSNGGDASGQLCVTRQWTCCDV